jgi:Sec-independent protein translocase protein TatA
MLDVSWGEITVVVGLGLAIIGRKDLPRASRSLGTQVGRVVGLLQGARARADRYAAQNELRQLQNELRSGLRELDAVKSELAVSITGRGLVGRSLGSMVAGANKQLVPSLPAPGSTTSSGETSARNVQSDVEPSTTPTADFRFNNMATNQFASAPLAPETQSIAAVAEEEWEKQGISFKSKAESGAGLANYDPSTSGSVMLANILTQSLIFDQYDRAVRKQDRVLQMKVESVRKDVIEGKQPNGTTAEPGKEE